MGAAGMFGMTWGILVSVYRIQEAGLNPLQLVLVSRTIRHINDPVMDAWTNQYVDSSVRATVFSMRGQGDALGQITFGPVMGAVATFTTIRVAFMGVAAMLIPSQVLYILASR